MTYAHLSHDERHYIQIERRKGTSQAEIARSLKRSQSTISRELTRNTGLRGYRHQQAHRLTQQRHQNKAKAIKLTKSLKQRIKNDLEQDWSPEQIAGRLKLEGGITLHHETIYQYILSDKKAGGTLHSHLRCQKKKYRKRYGSAHKRTAIPNRVDIDQRPAEANKRTRIGDWEADTIIGKNHKGALVTLDERVSKLRLAAPLAGKRAQPVTTALIALLKPMEQLVKTVTFDNGKEFSQHEQIADALNCQTFFAKPYHSWERGQNENANGLLRQYFPKAAELVDTPVQKVIQAVDRLNSRPKKCLDFKTPYEVFQSLTGVDARPIILGYALMT